MPRQKVEAGGETPVSAAQERPITMSSSSSSSERDSEESTEESTTAIVVHESAPQEPTTHAYSIEDSMEATLAQACNGLVTVDDDDTVRVDNHLVPLKRPRDAPDSEQDHTYESIRSHVVTLSKRIKTLEAALATIRTAASIESPASEAQRFIEVKTTGCSSSAPRLLLSPTHKNAFLNNVRLRVDSWTHSGALSIGELQHSRFALDFPHKVRREKSGLLAKWVEVHPRKFSLGVRVCIGDSLCEDPSKVLNHANQLLPAGQMPPSELKFVCYLLYGSAPDGFDAASRPSTSLEDPIFKNPQHCLVTRQGKPVASFFHGETPTTKFTAAFQNGRVVFRDVAFNEACLSSNVVHGDGSWRLCVRALHPALKNLANFSVCTDSFFTSRRVREIKAS